MTVVYREKSKRSRSGLRLVLLLLAFVALILGYATYVSMEAGKLAIDLYFVGVFLGIVVWTQAFGRYEYVLTEDSLIIIEQGLFGKKSMTIPYAMIDGVYAFKQQLMGGLKFRYKFRKLSSMDPRPVWALAYAVEAGNKIKHGRILLKADESFFEKLNEFVPNRVCVPQEEVVFYAYVREDAHKHGENVETYYAQIMAQSNEQNDDVTKGMSIETEISDTAGEQVKTTSAR
ncbi:hypothetical protein [uncultured Veillonella sp.]|uniref:hypothetical protein n=1 Tax=uncultured Veillonella sp. TaxID=159268 RepID=UPI002590243B|nr:hypothetical protein [uncultured Veillonella sp.]